MHSRLPPTQRETRDRLIGLGARDGISERKMASLFGLTPGRVHQIIDKQREGE